MLNGIMIVIIFAKCVRKTTSIWTTVSWALFYAKMGVAVLFFFGNVKLLIWYGVAVVVAFVCVPQPQTVVAHVRFEVLLVVVWQCDDPA